MKFDASIFSESVSRAAQDYQRNQQMQSQFLASLLSNEIRRKTGQNENAKRHSGVFSRNSKLKGSGLRLLTLILRVVLPAIPVGKHLPVESAP